MGIFSSLFGKTQKPDFQQLIDSGAIVIDVRTKSEFSQGSNKKSINIPLDSLDAAVSKFNKATPIITCCASGMRSRVAKMKLQSLGFQQVENGGSWLSLRKYFN